VQVPSPGAQQFAHGPFAVDARAARPTPTHVLFEGVPIGGRDLAVDVWSDERVDRGAIRH
jgi:hypothetical protein